MGKPHLNGQPHKSSGGKMVESELVEIPKGWSLGKFGSLVRIVNGYAIKNKDFKEIGEDGFLKIRKCKWQCS
jgi:type I restriction enzyme S subunit